MRDLKGGWWEGLVSPALHYPVPGVESLLFCAGKVDLAYQPTTSKRLRLTRQLGPRQSNCSGSDTSPPGQFLSKRTGPSGPDGSHPGGNCDGCRHRTATPGSEHETHGRRRPRDRALVLRPGRKAAQKSVLPNPERPISSQMDPGKISG